VNRAIGDRVIGDWVIGDRVIGDWVIGDRIGDHRSPDRRFSVQ